MVYESTKCYQSAGPSATALFSRTVRTILLRKVLVRKERGTTGGSVKNWGGGGGGWILQIKPLALWQGGLPQLRVRYHLIWFI